MNSQWFALVQNVATIHKSENKFGLLKSENEFGLHKSKNNLAKLKK